MEPQKTLNNENRLIINNKQQMEESDSLTSDYSIKLQ